MLLYTGVAAGAGYIYLRVFRGWRLTDLMYVTRSSLSRSLSSVTAGAAVVEVCCIGQSASWQFDILVCPQAWTA